MHRPTNLKYAVLAGFLAFGMASANVNAKTYPERAEEALQEYLAAFLRAKTPSELTKYWSKRYTRVQQLESMQLASLPPETRAQVEADVHRSMQQIVRDIKERFTVTCEATDCKARAVVSGKGSKTYTLVREDGRILIDNVEINLAS